jgi:mono/diheme cytochrome c family protein
MKSIKLALVCAAIALFGFGCNQDTQPTNSTRPVAAASPTATATPDELAAARVTYEKHCTACHGEKAEGGLVKVDNKRLKVPSLKSEHAIKHSDEDLVKKIVTGGDGMPSFKAKLSPAEIQALVHLIRKDFQGK